MPFSKRVPRGRVLLAALLCGVLSGCAALTNPVANGVPVRRLPPELLGEPKEGTRPLPLTLLRQKPPAAYRLGPEDDADSGVALLLVLGSGRVVLSSNVEAWLRSWGTAGAALPMNAPAGEG